MSAVSLFMVGDVMLGRGVDQILEYSCHPKIYECNGLDARGYVTLAVRRYGALPEKSKRGVGYVWGDALGILEEKKPDVRIINLETSVTTNDQPWPLKGIHYRMHPGNINVIQAAKIDCCVLANNHTADWGFAGLEETLQTFEKAGIAYVGAGHNISEAQAPAVFNVPGKGRVLVFAAGHYSSGIPDSWQAKSNQCGVNIVEVESSKSVAALSEQIKGVKQKGDIVVFSIHWGGNWGWDVESAFRRFAHDVIDKAEVDVVYGHSSHHVKGIEVYKGKPIIYGCGDFLDDYEGIHGHESYNADLSLMYFVKVGPITRTLVELRMVPTKIRHLQVIKAKEEDIKWMHSTMSRECRKFGCDVHRVDDELVLKF